MIKTCLGSSIVSGIGLFANEFIKKGRVVWEYYPTIDLSYSKEAWRQLEKNLAKPSFNMLSRYAYKENGKYILCMDNAQFMNHSIEDCNIQNTKDLKTMFAIRDIQVGEELLCNYFEYSDEDDKHVRFLRDSIF